MDTEARLALAEQIKIAFKDAPYPTDGPITYEREEDFVGKHWSEISIEAILRHRDSLAAFSDGAWRYFLPTFLIAVVLHPDKVDTLSSGILYYLYPPEPYNKLEEFLRIIFERRVLAFNSAEKQAITAFLEAYKDLFPDDWQRHAMVLEDAILFWWLVD
jgi:hypothetical protein